MQKKKGIHIYLAYIAAILMIIGVNLPLFVQLNDKGETELVTRIDNEGIILLISAIACIIFRYLKKNKYLLISVIYQFGTMVYYVIIFMHNSRFKSIHAGFVCEIISLLLLISALFVNVNKGSSYTHDMSTIRVIETEEYVYNEKIVLKDCIWIIIAFILTAVIVGLKLYVKNDKSSAANKISEAKSLNKDLKNNGYDYECEEYALSIDDAYITNDAGKEIVFVSVKIKNKKKKAISFKDRFTMSVKQGNKVLEKCGDSETTTFDINSKEALISYYETSNIYIPYFLDSSEEDVSITISAIINKQEKLLTNKIVRLNDLYYVDEITEIIEHDRKTNKETTLKEQNNMKDQNDDIDNSKDVSNDEIDEKEENTNSKDNKKSLVEDTDEKNTEVKTDAPDNDNTKNEAESKTQAPIQSKEPKESKEPTPITTEPVMDKLSGNIMFQKPSSWDDNDKAYLCLYNNESDTEEYAKIYMKNYENGIYTFYVSNITKGKTVYIAFTNGKDMYPLDYKFILFLGQKYKSN